MSMQVLVFEIGSYQILNMISLCQQTCAKLPNTRSYFKKNVSSSSRIAKNKPTKKNFRRSESSSCFGKGPTKNSKYLTLLRGKHE